MENKNNIQKIVVEFFLFLIVMIITGYLFNYLNHRFFHYSSKDSDFSELIKKNFFFLIAIAGPVIETIIFIWIPISILKNFKVNNLWLLVLIPSILFASSHIYHPIYFIMAFIHGILMNIYFQCNAKRSVYEALGLVTLLHGTYNLYGFLFVM